MDLTGQAVKPKGTVVWQEEEGVGETWYLLVRDRCGIGDTPKCLGSDLCVPGLVVAPSSLERSLRLCCSCHVGGILEPPSLRAGWHWESLWSFLCAQRLARPVSLAEHERPSCGQGPGGTLDGVTRAFLGQQRPLHGLMQNSGHGQATVSNLPAFSLKGQEGFPWGVLEAGAKVNRKWIKQNVKQWNERWDCGATSQIYSSPIIYAFILKEGTLPVWSQQEERVMNHKYSKTLRLKKCS